MMNADIEPPVVGGCDRTSPPCRSLVRSSSVPVLLVLRRAVDGGEPRLAPFDPDLRLRLKTERCVVQRSDAYLNPFLADADEAGTATGTEAPAVVGRELPGELERFARPLAVDRECAPRLLP